MADEFNITDILNSLKKLFHWDQPKATPTTSTPSVPSAVESASKGYQSPIKSGWKNSGDYSPNAPTDPRHPNGHQGVDMRAPGGTAVYPMAPGIVTNVGTDPKGGNVVNIDHGNGVKTYYAHLGTIKVYKGDKVNYDTIIATVGDTGNAKGTVPHVHFQVWRNGQLQNPGNFFSVPKYENFNAQKEQMWLPGAKNEAVAWTMKDHVQHKRVAFSKTVNDIYKVSVEFYKLSSKG
jgi:murein DD-endopeptidase MepM/ murein hydrolase activator NlpD